MSEDPFAEFTPIITQLTSEAIRCSPDTWTAGTLRITCDGTRIDYSLKSPEQEGKASISPELAQLCEQLYVTMARTVQPPWTECLVDFHQSADEPGSWKMNTNFNYDS